MEDLLHVELEPRLEVAPEVAACLGTDAVDAQLVDEDADGLGQLVAPQAELPHGALGGHGVARQLGPQLGGQQLYALGLLQQPIPT